MLKNKFKFYKPMSKAERRHKVCATLKQTMLKLNITHKEVLDILPTFISVSMGKTNNCDPQDIHKDLVGFINNRAAHILEKEPQSKDAAEINNGKT